MYQKVKVTLGKKYNRLTPVAVEGKDKYGKTLYRCICECGKETILVGSLFTSGHVKSCGCLRGYGLSYSITYKSWVSAKARCLYKNHPYYIDYGGRGIKMCDRWLNSFSAFLEDMGERPSRYHTLDRIDTNGDYEPNNCRWATIKEQCNNRRNNHFIDYRGEKLTVADFARKYDFNINRLYYELNKGFDIEYILQKYKDKPVRHFVRKKNQTNTNKP